MQESSKKEIDSLNKKSSDIFRLDIDKSLKLAEKAQLFSVYHDYKKGHADSLINRAWNSVIRCEYLVADKLFNKAKGIFESINDIDGKLKANAGLSELNIIQI